MRGCLPRVPMRTGETLSEWGRIDPGERARRTDAVWADERVHRLPKGWRNLLIEEHQKMHATAGRAEANRWLLSRVAQLGYAQKIGIEPGDTDETLCCKALVEALLMASSLEAVRSAVTSALMLNPHGLEEADLATRNSPDWVTQRIVRAQTFAARFDLSARGMLKMWPQGAAITRAGALARLIDDRWWRRALRKTHALMIESTAIDLGIVRKDRGCYVSDDSLQRRTSQRLRNARTLAAVAAVNDRGQEFTLADMAAKGVGNASIRRAELMTRISGFELIANELGHTAQFVTVTCPSRMHKWRRGSEESSANASYDGTFPGDAQRYLAGQWAKARAALARAGLPVYGFRIAEPHHDGCPHWHLLLWHRPVTERGVDASTKMSEILHRYFLFNDSATETGAGKHRVTIEDIDPSKGSAVAYVAKYVAKNIDGYQVGSDLYGNAALESAARVEAWAATWRVRQFQQIGGAPVTVWRELRRVHPLNAPVNAVQSAHDGIAAVNHGGLGSPLGPPDSEQDEKQRIRYGWARYVRIQGGPVAKRPQHTLRLHREKTGELNRYGELKGSATLGVACFGDEVATVGIATFRRPRVDLLESERCEWIICTKPALPMALQRQAAHLRDEAKILAAKSMVVRDWYDEHGANLKRLGEALSPWTRVNNCTQVASLSLVRHVVTTRKRGVFFDWGAPPTRVCNSPAV